ncbi:hypothetical protein [Micromonospora sp. DT47]|uniref:hypothetical protein n=1 Tax=Micromonospora sp. DT47 TaxID=3393431 RepID=UPI003CEBD235
MRFASPSVPLALTGCARSTSGQTPQAGGYASVAAGAKAADLVPAALKDKGVLRMATAEGYPPMEMYKEGTQDLIGVEAELAAGSVHRRITRMSWIG